MKSKTVLFYNIGDFYVEAEQTTSNGEEMVAFWLARNNYGIKISLFDIPMSEVPEGKIENAFAEYIALFCDREYMDGFLEDLLEGEEVDENFNII